MSPVHLQVEQHYVINVFDASSCCLFVCRNTWQELGADSELWVVCCYISTQTHTADRSGQVRLIYVWYPSIVGQQWVTVFAAPRPGALDDESYTVHISNTLFCLTNSLKSTVCLFNEEMCPSAIMMGWIYNWIAGSEGAFKLLDRKKHWVGPGLDERRTDPLIGL